MNDSRTLSLEYDEVLAAVRQMLLPNIESAIPTHLYHYTTAKPLHNLLSNHQIEARDTTFSSEEDTRYGYDIISQAFNSLVIQHTADAVLQHQFTKRFDARLLKMEHERSFYITSFTELRDSPLQWSKFRDKQCYSVGIPISSIISDRVKDVRKKQIPCHYFFGKVIYDKVVAVQLCLKIIKRYMPVLTEVFSVDDEKKSDIRLLVRTNHLFQFLDIIRQFFRKAVFDVEKEWRYVEFKNKGSIENWLRTELLFSAEDRGILSYLNWNLSTLSKVSELMVGPSRNIHQQSQTLQQFASAVTEKMTDIPKVECSQVSITL